MRVDRVFEIRALNVTKICFFTLKFVLNQFIW